MQESKLCKTCGRPLPENTKKKRCEACQADRRAKVGKVVAGIGTALSAVASVAIAIVLRRR